MGSPQPVAHIAGPAGEVKVSYSSNQGTAVEGLSDSGSGIEGESKSGFGVTGHSDSGKAVSGISISGIGVYGSGKTADNLTETSKYLAI